MRKQVYKIVFVLGFAQISQVKPIFALNRKNVVSKISKDEIRSLIRKL